MIKIIVKETGEKRGNKIAVDMTVEVRGDINSITTQLGYALFDLWNQEPKIILKTMGVLDDLISDNLKGDCNA